MTTIAPSLRLNIPTPVDATRVSPWIEREDETGWQRLFDGTHRTAADLSVDIAGVQKTDGSILLRWVTLGVLEDGPNEPIQATSSQTRDLVAEVLQEVERTIAEDSEYAEAGRELAAALTAAADEIDLLACPLCLGSGVIPSVNGDVLCSHGIEAA